MASGFIAANKNCTLDQFWEEKTFPFVLFWEKRRGRRKAVTCAIPVLFSDCRLVTDCTDCLGFICYSLQMLFIVCFSRYYRKLDNNAEGAKK